MEPLTHEQMFQNYIDAIASYTGGENTEAFRSLIKAGIPAWQQDYILRQAGYTVVKNINGTYSYIGKPTTNPPTTTSAATVNSNLQTGTSGINGGSHYEEPFGTEGAGTSDGNVKESATTVFLNGAATAGAKILGVGGKALSTVMAYNVGLNLGKVVDGALYDANPEFWDEHGMSTLDPSTWGEISSEIDNSAGRFAFNLLAGVRSPKETGKPTLTMYADENAQAYFAKWLVTNGYFATEKATIPDNTQVDNTALPHAAKNTGVCSTEIQWIYHDGVVGTLDGELYLACKQKNFNVSYTNLKHGKATTFITASASIPTDSVFYLARSDGGVATNTGNIHVYTYNNKTVYYSSYTDTRLDGYNSVSTEIELTDDVIRKTAWYLLYGAAFKSEGQPGVNDQSNSTIFDPSSLNKDSTIEDYRNAIREQFPWLYDNRIEYNVAQPDGSTKTYTYVPISIADGYYKNANQPTGNADTKYQGNYSYDGSSMTDTLISTLLNWLTNEKASNLTKPDTYTGTKTPTNAPSTGSGNTPIAPPTTGKASALYSIYNPTLEQINKLGAWLWSSNFIDQLLKLFSSPMDAIIGLHKVYATPATGAEQNVKVGYLDSGVPSKIVTEQYTTIDCGTVNCYEYFGNVFDYNPYTNLRLYLPFIGIIDLANSDVMRSSINVVYHVDVLSGACLAEVKIMRDGGGGTLYQYAGNACTTLPISSGSYMGVISSVSSVATRALAGFASGGALGAVASGATGVLNAQGTNVVHSGGFSGNAGAMGCKKPYLIVERPQTETADNTAKLLGYGSNMFVQLKTCKGLTRVKGVHVDAVPATKEEKKLIEEKLMDGVVIS